MWEDVREWAHWNHSFDRHFSSLGPWSCVFTSWASSGLTIGSGCSLMATRQQVFFFPSSLMAHWLMLGTCNLWWLWHSCLLIWQEIFQVSSSYVSYAYNRSPLSICCGPGATCYIRDTAMVELNQDPWVHRCSINLIKPVNPKGNQPWIFIGKTDAEAEAPIFWPPDVRSRLIGKDPNVGKDWGEKEKGATENGMAGWHHRINGHEFEQTSGESEGQGSLEYCSPWSRKESDMT